MGTPEQSIDVQRAAGMCPHGNFPDSCTICQNEGLEHADGFMQKQFKNYELTWRADQDKDTADYVTALRDSYRSGDYRLTLGQLSLDLSTLRSEREESGKTNDTNKASFDFRIKQIEDAQGALAERQYPELKQIKSEDYINQYFSEETSLARQNSRELIKDNKEAAHDFIRRAEDYNRIAVSFDEGDQLSLNEAHVRLSKDIAVYEKELAHDYAHAVFPKGSESRSSKREDVVLDEVFQAQQLKLFKMKRTVELIANKLLEDARTIGDKVTLDKIHSELEAVAQTDIKPNFLGAQRFRERFKSIQSLIDKQVSYKDMSFTEQDSRDFLAHLLGVLNNMKMEIKKAKEQNHNENIRAGGNVASILGNGGEAVITLQLLLAKKGNVKQIPEIVKMDFKDAVRQALDYEIDEPEWDAFFA